MCNKQKYNGINKNIRKMQTRQDLLNSYIINTKFYDYLRSKLNGNLSALELKELVSGIQSIVRYKVEIVPSSLPQPVYMIVVYGEMYINGVTSRKGEYVKMQETTDTFDINFLKPTTLLLINLVEQIKTIRQKMRMLQICMPIKQLKLTISETRKVAKIVQIRQINVKYTQIPKESGVFLFYNGVFQICNGEIPALEMENNFIQITQPIQFTIRLRSNEGKYGFIPRQELYDLLAPDAVIQLQKIWKQRQQIKGLSKSRRDYLDEAERLREKIRKKIKQNKKFSLNERSGFEASMKQNLEASRRSRLQKCSTAVTTLNSFSLDSAKKTASTLYNSKTFYTVSSPIKQKQSLRYQKTEDKLNKMRTYSVKKTKTKLEKEWYHIDQQKMHQTLSMTYFKIKKDEKNQKQVSTMCNYKRIHKIYSDPCFKRCLTFRTY